MTAIFISHSSKDNAAAEQLAVWLKEQRFESLFLDFDPQFGIPAGRDWEQELYHQLRVCRAVIVLCSEHSLASSWCFAEVAMACALGKELFPIRIDDSSPPSLLADRQTIELPQEPSRAHERLWRGLSQRFHRGEDLAGAREAAYERLLRGLIQAGLDPRDLFQWDARRPPYPGLMAFQEADAAIFFGRDDAIRDGIDAIRKLRRFGEQALLMVLGASGCGKSSLLRAGLLPNLRRDPENWLVLDPFRPATDPFAELAIVLATAFDRHGEPRERRDLADRLRALAPEQEQRGNELAELLTDLRVRAAQPEATVVLSIDQFEELLGEAGSPQAREFLTLLRAALQAADHRLVVLATLRSDFLGSFQCHPALQALPFDQLMIGPMGVDGYSRTIEGPAQVAGLELESGLCQRMVQDTETGDALPLLAFTLRELWEYEGRGEGRLSIEAYATKLQGLTGSVQRAADEVLTRHDPPLSEAQTDDLRRAFVAMTRINEQGNYARRSADWEELPPGSRQILERFVEARLLVSKQQGTVEVAHEALLRNWPLLKGWLDENREFLLWRERFKSSLIEFDLSGTLLSGKPLATAEGWRTATAPDSAERKLIDASLAARRRQRRSRRGSVLAAFVALAGFSVWSWYQLQQNRVATAQQYATNANLFARSNPLRSVVHGLAAMGTLDDDARESIALTETMVNAMANNIEAFGGAEPTGQGLLRSLLVLRNGELVSGGQNGTLRRWRDGRPLGAAIPTGQDSVSSLVELGNGELVSGGGDGTLRRWRDAEPVGQPIPTEQGEVYALAVLGNGELVSGGENGTLRRWKEGRPLGAPIPTGQGKVYRLVVLANGDLVSGGSKGTLRWWRDGKPRGEPVQTGQERVLSLLEGRNGDLISGGSDGTLRRWRDGKAIGDPLPTAQEGVGSLVELRNGDLISGGSDGTLRRWRDGRALQEPLQTGQERVWSLARLSNGELVSGGSNGTLRRWRTSEPLSTPIQTFQERVLSLAVLSNGELITGGRDGNLRRWRGGKIHGYPIPTGQLAISSLVVLSNGEVVSGGKAGTLRRWREGRAVGGPIATDQGQLFSLIHLRNGEVVSGGENGTIRRWKDGRPLGDPISTDQGLVSSLVEMDNGELITGGGDGSIRRWKNGLPLGPPIPTEQEEVLSLLALRNGELISGGSDGSIRRWRDGKPLGKPIPTDQGQVWSLLEWGNGEVLSGGNDGTLRVWRSGIPQGELIHTGQGRILGLVRLSGVQNRPQPQLVSASDDGTFRIFLRPEVVIREACLQLLQHPALVSPKTPAEREARTTCKKHRVF